MKARTNLISVLICFWSVFFYMLGWVSVSAETQPNIEYDAYKYNSVSAASRIMGDLNKNGNESYINGSGKTYAVFNNMDFGEFGTNTFELTYTNGISADGTVYVYIFDCPIEQSDTPDTSALSSLGSVTKSDGSVFTGRRVLDVKPDATGDWKTPKTVSFSLSETVTGVKSVMVCRNWSCDIYGISFQKNINISINNLLAEYFYEGNTKKLKISANASVWDGTEIIEYGLRIKPKYAASFETAVYSGYDNKLYGDTSFYAILSMIPPEYTDGFKAQAYICIRYNETFKTIWSDIYDF